MSQWLLNKIHELNWELINIDPNKYKSPYFIGFDIKIRKNSTIEIIPLYKAKKIKNILNIQDKNKIQDNN